MIQEITVLSGKGGTGKTTVTAALAAMAQDTVFSDCDVDASDLHLLLKPRIIEEHAFNSGSHAEIDTSKCISCGLCQEECRFDAIAQPEDGLFVVDSYQCEGCRLCEKLCPAQAITQVNNMNNYWYVSETRFGSMVHAHMGPGEENSGKLVTTVRNKAKEIAIEKSGKILLNDGPPGIGCPVIASLTGVQKVLLVVEPSITGLHDIRRISELLQKFSIPAYGIINKHDLNPELTLEAHRLIDELGIILLGQLSFDEDFVRAMIDGMTIMEFAPHNPNVKVLQDAWRKLIH